MLTASVTRRLPGPGRHVTAVCPSANLLLPPTAAGPDDGCGAGVTPAKVSAVSRWPASTLSTGRVRCSPFFPA